MLPADVVEGDAKKLKRPQTKVRKCFESTSFHLVANRFHDIVFVEQDRQSPSGQC